MARLILISLVSLGLAVTRALFPADISVELPSASASATASIAALAASPRAAEREQDITPLEAPEPIRVVASVPAPTPAALEPGPALEEPSDPDVRAILTHLRSRHTGLSRAELPEIAELIVAEAKRNDIKPALALAVIRVESGCFNYAVSHVGAMGLMQLMPATGEELARKHGLAWHGEESLFDPRLNVKLGLAYLKQLSDRYGSVKTALAAYNWGPGRIDRRLRRGQGVPKLYATQVMSRLQQG